MLALSLPELHKHIVPYEKKCYSFKNQVCLDSTYLAFNSHPTVIFGILSVYTWYHLHYSSMCTLSHRFSQSDYMKYTIKSKCLRQVVFCAVIRW